MKKFMALYMAPLSEFDKWKQAKPEEMEAGREVWNRWMEANKDIIVQSGALGKTKRVRAEGVEDTRNEIGGYSIVEAESHEEAAKLFENHPNVEMQGAWIDIMECKDMSKV